MSGKRVRRTRRTGWSFLVTVVALAAVVGLLGWWVTRIVTDDVVPAAGDGNAGAADTPSDTPSAAPADAPSDRGDADADAEAAIEQCVTELDQVETAVAAARPGIASWREHTRARTDMLAGRISEKRMEAIYDHTRHAGHAAQPRFTDAVDAVGEPDPCEALRGLDASGDDRAAGCLGRSEAAGAAYAAARETMDEWSAHLRHMDEYADGGMRTGTAMRLWVAAWREAPQGLRAYADRTAKLRAAPACTSR